MSNDEFAISEEEIHAYVDGMLPEARRVEIEQRLEHDARLAQRVSQYYALNHMLHARYDRVLNEPLPPRLRGTSSRHGAWLRRRDWRALGGMAAALVAGIGIGASFDSWRHQAMPRADLARRAPTMLDAGESFARQSAMAHVIYAPEVRRPVEVGADREQELVKWVSNRLGADVRPPILTRTGFSLMGGRLLPSNHGPVAQFMYHDANGERITLCISHRDLAADVTAFRLYQDGPVNVFYWIDGKFGYAVSGGIDRQRLLELAHDVQAQVALH